MTANNIAAYMPLLAIMAMAAVTAFMRTGGFWVMNHVPITPRLRRMLEALPGSVVAAVVLPLVAREGASALLAVCAVIVAMIVRRNEVLALIAGIVTAIAARAAGL